MHLSRLAITLGDPAGIGPEVILKALADPSLTSRCEITVVGSRLLLEKTHQTLLAQGVSEPLVDPDHLTILEVKHQDTEQSIRLGQGTVASGAASYQYLEMAIAHALKGDFQGIVTGPIAKSAWKAAGFNYPGQTELLAERAGAKRFGMLFVARSPHTGWTLRTLLATTHIPLAEVPRTLNADLMTQKLGLLVTCLEQDFGLTTPKIVIAGLNPHSGEQGQLGTEEQTWLIPWLQHMRDRFPHIHLDGPIPPDTLWVKPGQAWFGLQSNQAKLKTQDSELTTSPADAYLALYHDQGLIPVKLMAFDCAVNTSIGLPFVRTSPDHGTAFDIAGQGVADAASMKAAILLADELSRQRFGKSEQ